LLSKPRCGPPIWGNGYGAGLGVGPAGGAFFLWDIGVKHGDIRALGALSYAAPVLSTLLLVISAVPCQCRFAGGLPAVAVGRGVGGARICGPARIGLVSRAANRGFLPFSKPENFESRRYCAADQK